MKKYFILPLLALLFTGCSSMMVVSEAQDKGDKEQAMGEVMLNAFKKQNYEEYIQFIPPGGRQAYSKEKFKTEQSEIASRMGKIDSFRFLTRLEKEPLHELVWAVRFQSYTLKGDKIFKEILFSIVVGEVDGTRRVFLFGFK